MLDGMHEDGRMTVPGLPYDGMPALEARKRIVDELKAQGLLVKEEPYSHEVGHCDRCHAVIEPLISEQCWLRMDEMRDKALVASAAGKVRWHPERYERTYLDWLRGLRDWNIGRQLWLGHRVPVYRCDNGHVVVTVDPPGECLECRSTSLIQDPDVLDTWFSSALWPFATLGWPDDTEDLEAFYPTDMNCTAREIINLWVSRMIMTGIEFMGEVPFSDVVIHCQVQAADGRRMSKSLGTGVDPRDLITKYGGDALRAWAASVAMSSQDVRFDETRIEGFRRFANKLWNATRLVLGGLGEDPVPSPAPDGELELIDRWVLSRLQDAAEDARRGIEEYEFQLSVAALYDFAWHDFCDWYLEAVKPRLRDGDPAARAVLVHVLDVLLRLLHPFMPFVTEELWARLPGDRELLDRTTWPAVEERFRDPVAEASAERLINLVEAVRRARQAAAAPPKGGRLHLEDGTLDSGLEPVAAHLAAVELTPVLATPGIALPGVAARVEFPTAAGTNGSLHRKELQRLHSELDRARNRLANAGFLAKAPAEVVEKERARVAELQATIERLS